MLDELNFEKYFDELITNVFRLKIGNTFFEVLFNVSEKFQNETDYFCNLDEIPKMIRLMMFVEPKFRGSQSLTLNVLKSGTEKQIIRTIHITIAEVIPNNDYEYFPLYPQIEPKVRFKLIKPNESKTLRFDAF